MMRIDICNKVFVFFVGLFLVVIFSGSARATEELIVTAIEVEGNELVSEDLIRATIGLEVGDVFTEDQIREDLRALYDLGYFTTNIRVDFSGYEGGVKVVYHLEENRKIAEIDIEGNTLVPDEEIYGTIDTQVGMIFNFVRLKQDLQKIAKLYSDKEAAYLDIKVDHKDIPEGIYVVFKIKDELIAKDIVIEGNEIITTEMIEGVMQVERGKIISGAQLKEDLEKIGKLYKDEEYVLIADPKVDISEEGVVTISLVEGKLEKIEIKGNVKTKDFVIRRELKEWLRVGETLNLGDVRNAIRGIFDLRFFEDIIPQFTQGSAPDKLILTVEVIEARTFPVTVGVSYNKRDGVGGFLEAGDINLFGRGQEAQLKWQFGNLTTYQLSFYDPWIGAHRTSLGLEIYQKSRAVEIDEEDEEEDITDYRMVQRGGSISLGRSITEAGDLRLSLGYNYEEINNTPLEEEGKAPDDGYLNWVSTGLVHDTRDSQANPTSGQRNSISTEFGWGVIEGPKNYTKTTLGIRRYLRLADRQVLAFQSYGGFMTGKFPDYKKFVLGGTMTGVYTLRGYNEREFKGERFLVFNTEYRYILDENIIGIAFVDVGDAWDREDPLSLSYFKIGAGLGLHINIAFGPLRLPMRLDYGFGKKEGGMFHFRLGFLF